jgi:hypothetical protein
MKNRLAKAFFVFFHCLFVIGGGFSLNKGYGVRWAGWKTISKAIAIIVTHKLCFAVHHAYCAFVAGFSTSTTTIALFFVYLYNSSYHMVTSVFLLISFVSA